MNDFTLIKPGALIWIQGTKSFYDGSSESWECPFRIISIISEDESMTRTKSFDYEVMKEIEFSFVRTGKYKFRLCDPLEAKKYLTQKKAKINKSIQEFKDKIDLLSINIDIIESHITKL
jgi:hypothetical protein